MGIETKSWMGWEEPVQTTRSDFPPNKELTRRLSEEFDAREDEFFDSAFESKPEAAKKSATKKNK